MNLWSVAHFFIKIRFSCNQNIGETIKEMGNWSKVHSYRNNILKIPYFICSFLTIFLWNCLKRSRMKCFFFHFQIFSHIRVWADQLMVGRLCLSRPGGIKMNLVVGRDSKSLGTPILLLNQQCWCCSKYSNHCMVSVH